ncbi:hypothetical protein C8D76_1263 [Pasteurella langaaensis DSM 22999]|uniref:Uncharacterized protein n=1 Tax=Alitibacter langaaensis DSM 22999 TaxID=1122935 RepID=A0A2U0SJY7_9PAST|nr:hypothetical protein [Pasteurella langaaensis]PVX31666.1 hypothetical protein C8D76_1263 [Pasteurella langaaensis DSM 22999]
MAHEETSPISTALFSAIPLILLLAFEFICALLGATVEVAQYAIALFTAEILLLIVFMKGQICNGQRGRLINANQYMAIYWLLSAIVVCTQIATVGILPLLLSIIGLMIVAMIYLRSWLAAALALAICGVVISLYFVGNSPLRLSPIAQMLVGVILANIALSVSRNRLQGFIALLPFLMALLVVVNVIYTLAMLCFAPNIIQPIEAIKDLPAEFPAILYFVLHLVIMAILAVHILRKIKLDYFNLILLLILASSLPVWATFISS